MNLNEVGQYIRINLDEDISLSTPTLILTPQVGASKEITTGVSIPSSDVTVDGVTLSANEYVEYQTVDGDLDYVGKWKYKVKLYFGSTDIRQTDYNFFLVKA